MSGLNSSGRHEDLKSKPAMELLDIAEQSDGRAKSVGNGPTNDVIDIIKNWRVLVTKEREYYVGLVQRGVAHNG